MKFGVDEELKTLLSEIQKQRKSEIEWAEIESDDLYQSENYRGGFDATEQEFCFSVFRDGKEYWFQFSLSDVDFLLGNPHGTIQVRLAHF